MGVTEMLAEPDLALDVLGSAAAWTDETAFVDEDEDEDDMSDVDLEALSSELPGLLEDAEMDLGDIASHLLHHHA